MPEGPWGAHCAGGDASYLSSPIAAAWSTDDRTRPRKRVRTDDAAGNKSARKRTSPAGQKSFRTFMKLCAHRPLQIVASLLLAASLFGCGGGGGGAAPPVGAPTSAQLPATEALIARARGLELNTPYVPPARRRPAGTQHVRICQDDAFGGIHHRARPSRRRRERGTSRDRMRSASGWAHPLSTAPGKRSASRSPMGRCWWLATSALRGA